MSLQVGSKAPDFELEAVVGQDFKKIKLSDFQAKGKWTVLFFYPLDFTFVCPTEIVAFSDRNDEFQKLGAEVLGCSIDSKFSHLAWINTERKSGGLGSLAFPLLADINKTVARDYGVLLEGAGIALRGIFIIDPAGVVQYGAVHNLSVGRSVDETLRVLKAFQYVTSHAGEVCPANWNEGKDTMKAGVNESKEYFAKAAK